jgi:hypothetical protein
MDSRVRVHILTAEQLILLGRVGSTEECDAFALHALNQVLNSAASLHTGAGVGVEKLATFGRLVPVRSIFKK